MWNPHRPGAGVAFVPGAPSVTPTALSAPVLVPAVGCLLEPELVGFVVLEAVPCLEPVEEEGGGFTTAPGRGPRPALDT